MSHYKNFLMFHHDRITSDGLKQTWSCSLMLSGGQYCLSLNNKKLEYFDDRDIAVKEYNNLIATYLPATGLIT